MGQFEIEGTTNDWESRAPSPAKLDPTLNAGERARVPSIEEPSNSRIELTHLLNRKTVDIQWDAHTMASASKSFKIFDYFRRKDFPL